VRIVGAIKGTVSGHAYAVQFGDDGFWTGTNASLVETLNRLFGYGPEPPRPEYGAPGFHNVNLAHEWLQRLGAAEKTLVQPLASDPGVIY
jgi:hypothetical protein